MPKGTPSGKELMSQNVGGFSLDTNVIEHSGFRYDSGDLGVLSQQLPSWLKLYISDVVRHEVVRHQQANTKEAFEKLKSAIKNAGRLALVDTNAIEQATTQAEPDDHGKKLHEQRL